MPVIFHRILKLQDARLKLHLLEQSVKVSSDPEEMNSGVFLMDKPASSSISFGRQATLKTSTEKRPSTGTNALAQNPAPILTLKTVVTS